MERNYHILKTILYAATLIITVIFKQNWFLLGLGSYLIFRMSFTVISNYFRERIDTHIYNWLESNPEDEPKRFQFGLLQELKYKKAIPYILLITILINFAYVATLLIDNMWIKSGVLLSLVVVYSQFYQEFYKSTLINTEYERKLGM